MQYDLEMIVELCDELGLRRSAPAPHEVLVELAEGVELVFQNFPNEDDCLMGFEGTEWHAHGDVIFSDRHGYYVETTYLDVLTGLADGTALLCELWRPEGLADRWIVHKDYVDEFRYMQDGDEIRVRPLGAKKPSSD